MGIKTEPLDIQEKINNKMQYSCMLVTMTVAGSDSIGGAGIQADIKAMSSIGVHPASVITCITAQNTQKVEGIYPLPIDVIESQMDSILSDSRISAAKTGMLFSGEIASFLAERLASEDFPVVVDPVLVAGVGDSLGKIDLLDALRLRILPIADCVTPNRHEAEALIGRNITTEEEVKEACEDIQRMGAMSVLIKGGHFEGEEAKDILLHDGEFIELISPRFNVKGHGGGCALSSYITAFLAKGMDMEKAVRMAKEKISTAFSMSYPVGKGVDVVNSLSPLEREAYRYPVMTRLGRAISDLLHVLPVDWVPEVGINFVFALPAASTIQDVCGIEGRIWRVGGVPSRQGCLEFGGSKHVATIVIAALSHDRRIRSAINLRFTPKNLLCFEKAGLLIGTFDRSDEPEDRGTMEWGTDHAIRILGYVPDVIFDRGGLGKEPMIRVLGSDPETVVSKIKKALEQW